MKAFILDRYGKKGTLRFGGMPEPALGDDDVLVEIHRAALEKGQKVLIHAGSGGVGTFAIQLAKHR